MDDIAAKRCTTRRADPIRTPWGLLLLLMAMTAIGPTTLNILVPALPQLAHQLGADVATIQLTVSLYLLALAVGAARDGAAVGPLRPPAGAARRARR